MGAHRLRRRQRRRDPAHAMAAAALRTEGLFPGVDRRLHPHRFFAAWQARSAPHSLRVVQGAFGGGLLATAKSFCATPFPASRSGLSQSIFALGTIFRSVSRTYDRRHFSSTISLGRGSSMSTLVPGIVAFVILLRYLRDDTRPQRAGVDVTGIALLVVAVSCMQYVLDQGQHDDWFSIRRSCCAPSFRLRQRPRSCGGSCASPSRSSTCRFGHGRPWPPRWRSSAPTQRSFSQPSALAAVYGHHAWLYQHAGRLADWRARIAVLLLTIPVGRLTSIRVWILRWLIGGGLAVAGFGRCGWRAA